MNKFVQKIPALLLLLLFQTPHLWAQLSVQPFFRGLTPLWVVETQYFEIIYPGESEETARALMSFADQRYEEISARLGITVKRKIPVAISPHVDEFNSFMNSMPDPHILLLDTPMDSDWTNFNNSLEKLFIHELTHAISLSTRGPVMDVFHAIFGGWVYPPGLNTPIFMTEGIAVSFESLDGYGRANDPLVKQKLRQEILENKFLNPHQVSGVSDLPAASMGAWYEYGGLFSWYLQETYGMEKYAALWQDMGKKFHFSFFFYNNGFYNLFKKIYGLSVEEAWDNFRDSLALQNIEASGDLIVNQGLPFKPKSASSSIRGMDGAGGNIFVLDRYSRQLLIYNGEKQKTEKVIPMGSSAYDVSASPTGDRFLVSAYQYHNNRAEAVVTEYLSKNGLPKRTWRGLYRGTYFRDGVLGISSDRHQNNIVFRTGDLPEEILLRGNAELTFYTPRPLDDTWIAFIVNRKGIRELGVYNYDTKQVYRVTTGLPDDQARWEFVRYLQVSEGRFLFGYNHDDRMYKLGLIDPESLTVVFTEREFSGAVALPVLAGDAIYYKGSFAGTDRLMHYPEKVEQLSGLRTELQLLPWEEEDAAQAAEAPAEALDSKLYLPFKYLNPLRLWLPMPLLRPDPKTILSLDGGGIYSVMIDPSETNVIELQAAMDARFMMADIKINWVNANLGFPLLLSFSDGVTVADETYRALRVNTESLFTYPLGSRGLQGILGAGFGFSRFFAQDTGDSNDAYSWDFHNDAYKFMARMGIGSLASLPWENFGHGFMLQTFGWLLHIERPSAPSKQYPRIDGYFQAAFEPVLPVRLSLYGAWDSYDMNLQGASSQHSLPVFQTVAAAEYQNSNITSLGWIAGGEAEFRLFSLNIQKSLSHLYFNRLVGTLAYRAALYDAEGITNPEGNKLGGRLRLTQSLVFRLGGGISSALVTSVPLKVNAYVQAALKLSKFGRGPVEFADVVAISPLISISY